MTRSQRLVSVPPGKVGRKSIGTESRVGNTAETDGNSSSFTMTLGGFMTRCPIPDDNVPGRFVVPGDFEYSLVVDSVNTDAVPTERKHYAKRMTAQIRVFVNDDLSVTEGEIDGAFFSDIDGVRAGPLPIRRRFPIRDFATPDMSALRDIVAATQDLAAAVLMWNASTTILDAQRTWREPNACARLEFDPPSETRTVEPGETVEIRVKYRARDSGQSIPKGTWDAAAAQGGRVTEASGTVQPDGTFVVRYAARSGSAPQAGDGARIEALAPAGYARHVWKVRTGLALAVEHRIMSRRDTAAARMGMALFDGDLRFEARLESVPGVPGEFRGQRTIRHELRVGHITPRCRGTASQTEIWDFIAHLDAASSTVKLEFSIYYPEDGVGFWVCDADRDDVYIDIGSQFPDQSQVAMSSRSGTRMQISRMGINSQETLTVTVQ